MEAGYRLLRVAPNMFAGMIEAGKKEEPKISKSTQQ
jgi:hypothetical protein